MPSDLDLRTALRRAAATLEVQAPPVARIAARGRRRGRLRALAGGLSVVVLLSAAGALGTVIRDAEAPPEIRAFSEESRSREAPEEAPPPGPSQVEAAGGDGARALVGSTTRGSDAQQEPRDAPLAPGPRVVKRADLTLEVERGAFQEIHGRAQRVAAAHDGYVAGSRTGGEDGRRGRLVIRVPAREFEEALADLKALGMVRAEEVSGEDVTAEFVDLRARLRNWRAQEVAIRGLMEDATSIEQTIRVQKELQRVRLEIERIRGSLRVLREQTSLGTISVAIREAGAPQEEEQTPGVLGRAWDRAVRGSLEVVAAVTVGLGYLLPILILLALGWLGFRVVRPRAEA